MRLEKEKYFTYGIAFEGASVAAMMTAIVICLLVITYTKRYILTRLASTSLTTLGNRGGAAVRSPHGFRVAPCRSDTAESKLGDELVSLRSRRCP